MCLSIFIAATNRFARTLSIAITVINRLGPRSIDSHCRYQYIWEDIDRYIWSASIYFGLAPQHTFFLSHFEPLPFRGMSLWSQGINKSLPRYTPCIFGLADWVSTPAPHQLTTNKLSRLLCLLTFSRFPRWKSYIAKKNPTHREANPRFLP